MEGYIYPDYTRKLTIEPLIVKVKPEKVSWLTKLWWAISGWEGWLHILLILLLALEGGLIGFLLYWFKYM